MKHWNLTGYIVLQGQGLFAGNKEIGFTGLVYPETEGIDTLEAG